MYKVQILKNAQQDKAAYKDLLYQHFFEVAIGKFNIASKT